MIAAIRKWGEMNFGAQPVLPFMYSLELQLATQHFTHSKWSSHFNQASLEAPCQIVRGFIPLATPDAVRLTVFTAHHTLVLLKTEIKY